MTRDPFVGILVVELPYPPGNEALMNRLGPHRKGCWSLTAAVRWVPIEKAALDYEKPLGEADVDRWVSATKANLVGELPRWNQRAVVFEWTVQNHRLARRLYESLRKDYPDLPLAIISAPTAAGTHGDDACATFLDPLDLSRSDSIIRALRAKGLPIPEIRLTLEPLPKDLAITKFIRTHGEQRLQSIFQRHFVQAKSIKLEPVEGGWSGDALCRFQVDNRSDQYFLKTFDDRSKYAREFWGHARARKNWLKRSTVELVPVPLLPPHPQDAQLKAFPEEEPALYCLCYASAVSNKTRRKTWKALYPEKDGTFQLGVLDCVLEILGKRNHGVSVEERLWKFVEDFKYQPPEPAGNEFLWTPELRLTLDHALKDLSPYLAALRRLRSNPRDDWNKLQALCTNVLPWLNHSSWVMLGHVHGDPNPRNCMVDPANSRDVLLIDCGDYRENGRLVADLALLERDIKLVLMETEIDAEGYQDLDVKWLQRWCLLEDELSDKLLKFSAESGDSLARRLIARIRLRAGEICERAQDKSVDHYFAALLYYSLAILKEPAVRRAKKLLALYSACKILTKLDA
jgi:hypothetical protein